MSSPISTTESKILLIESGGRCAFPGCGKLLVEEGRGGDNTVILGEMAHIVADSRQGPRGRHLMSDEERDSHKNLILLCREHHRIVDGQPLTYSVPVLREMKKVHESRVKESIGTTETHTCEMKNEKMYATLLQFKSLPSVVFKGKCDFEGDESGRVRQLVKYPKKPFEIVPYVFQPGWLYTFHNTKLLTNPFIQIVDPGKVSGLSSLKVWKNADARKIYVTLLNKAIHRYVALLGLSYDRDHKRYFFPVLETGEPRDVTYKSVTGRQATRNVVWQPVSRRTGEPRGLWYHLAVRVDVHCFAEKQWGLSIRPERHLTTDGVTPLPSEQIGKRVTRLKARMFNDKYLDEVNFWREYLASGRPNIILNFGNQSAVIETNLVRVDFSSPGIEDDVREVSMESVEEDLFTSAELVESLEGEEAEFEGEEDDSHEEEV